MMNDTLRKYWMISSVRFRENRNLSIFQEKCSIFEHICFKFLLFFVPISLSRDPFSNFLRFFSMYKFNIWMSHYELFKYFWHRVWEISSFKIFIFFNIDVIYNAADVVCAADVFRKIQICYWHTTCVVDGNTNIRCVIIYNQMCMNNFSITDVLLCNQMFSHNFRLTYE